MTAWFQDEAFWREGYPFMFSEDAFNVATEQVEAILRITGLTAGHVLDLCCGPGRHSLALARKGFAVTGVDASTFLLQKAHERGDGIEFVHSDMREFCRPSAFDLVVNLANSF